MKFLDLKDKINKLDKLAETEDITSTLVAISKTNSKSCKKFFNKFFEITDGGNPEWDV